MKRINTLFLALACTFAASGCADTKGMTATSETQPSANETQKEQAVVIVVFNTGVDEQEAEAVAARYGMQITQYYRTLSERNNKLYMALGSTTLSAEEMVSRLKADPHVESVSINHQRKAL